ncbi:ACP S-malonyltransferase [Fructobacillus fructosus]|uniref:ACP S-malonyltransferase n=1 Tax=Fructobacillus fructosus TaxID=1631 RepID=UPI002D92F322|nr:Malonyl CoA-acyl carrier protein transacylase (FabD) [Fructobacillus fructosus]CAK1252020.1 Malonyl CoA-acyl carrier protein transacylase (FabD) [Fructobacillus fructosus]CAK1252384.1 Malonyl CoA-acyl carrier protein transacylase (FabD) [Fructobacillus fructosus]
MRIGLLFNGQGSQKAGMGQDLYEHLPAFKERIDRASTVLGYNLVDVWNDEEKISQTKWAQPAIVAFDAALAACLVEAGVQNVVAGLGLSLGEYPALVANGMLTFDQAIALVKDRGAYMQAVGDENPGKMVAVLDDNQDMIVAIIEKMQREGLEVYAANFNTFNQLVIGGKELAVDQAVQVLTIDGVKKIVPLPVSGAFHTPLLKEAADKMAVRLADEPIHEAQYPVYSNTTKRVFEPESLKETLTKQIVSPTYFAQCLDEMVTDNQVDTLIEIGPGVTLSKFARKIVSKEITRYSVTDWESFEKVIAQVKEEG